MERNIVLMASPIPLNLAKPAAIVLHEKGFAQASFNGVPFPYTQSPSCHHMQSGELHLQWQHFRIRQPGCLFGDNKSLQRETLLSYWQTQFCEPSHFILGVWAVAPNPTLNQKGLRNPSLCLLFIMQSKDAAQPLSKALTYDCLLS